MISLGRIDQWGSPRMAQAAPVSVPVPAQQAVPGPTEDLGPFNLPKWVNVALGVSMIGAGVYSAVKPNVYKQSSFNEYTEIELPKATVDQIAAGGAVIGGLYIIMDSLGYKF